MKIKLLNLLILFCAFNLAAQQEVNTSFGTQMQTTFENLEMNRVPHGLLRDFAMEFTALDAFDGTVSDSSYVHPGTLKQIYKTLLFSRVNTSNQGFVQYEDFTDNWEQEREKGIIILSGLFYRYSKFLDDAYPNKININNNKISDRYNNGNWQDPYEEKVAFALAPSIITYRNLDFRVQLPQNLWYSNNPNEIQSVQVDFNDGQGYRNMTSGQAVNVQYSSAGEKVWDYKLVLNTGETLYSHSKIAVEEGIQAVPYGVKSFSKQQIGDGLGVDTLNIQAIEQYLGKYGSATVLVNYGNTIGEIRKPLIVVEGFDPGNVTSPEEPYGATDLRDFSREVLSSTSGNLIDIVTGSPNLNDNDQEYDIIYVNWSNGTDYLQRNALVLKEVIEWVNEEKTGEEENVVIGQSMGGLIARYALKNMEDEGVSHETRTYISQDAPHLGANVPLGYQAAARHANKQYVQSPFQLLAGELVVPLFNDGVAVSDYLELIDQPAARQLLVNRLDENFQIENNLFDQWQAELQGMGYPGQTRNVAISNGNQCAETQGFTPGGNLLSMDGQIKSGWLTDVLSTFTLLGNATNATFFLTLNSFTGELGFLTGLLTGSSRLNADININSLPNFGGSEQVYSGNITFTKKLLFLININTTITNESYTSPSNILSYDYFPGGVFSTGIQSSTQNESNVLYNLNVIVNSDPDFSFVPTVSALDIGKGDANLNSADFLKSYGVDSPPVSPKDSPFTNFISSYRDTPFVINSFEQTNGSIVTINNFNQKHLELFSTNGGWLAKEIKGENLSDNVTDCSNFCIDLEISGPEGICEGSAIYSFPAENVNWSISNTSIASIEPDGNEVTVNSEGQGRIKLTAEIENSDCGTKTSSITINLGKPDIYTIDSNGNKNYMGGSFNFSTSYTAKGSFSVFSDTPNTTLTWSGAASLNWWNLNNNTVEFDRNIEGNYFFTVTADNGNCSHNYFVSLQIGGSGPDPFFTVAPNPVENKTVVVNDISSKSNMQSGQALSQNMSNEITLLLYNFQGKLVKTKIFRRRNLMGEYRLNVSGFKNRNYFLRIVSGPIKETHQLILNSK
ncbi:hypothetical protein APR41_06870 [Salegentibacter salinarum]|uniref:DUF676 domain-containing protein n=1 Tax=Salegentibacter salinarum TaxID=447422 RepID=A0A2N0TQZ2_9FLAO|nr:hypothetical protein [Salegentibacter salinarum]PKD17150.1 hypothetical protein APR41_06870 [Salegentibacter salinarum]SKB55655.1 Putative serine esterase [Salegentibacter salinarum]